ncbi:MAG: tRNA threonylcarbamoyladenosine dehydratase [Spirochaetes bacterium]|nr:tRNA threonylcarbamoyladenosine dehydratase [Spirochaetota bacterium]
MILSYESITQRTALLLGPATMEMIRLARVMLVGLGGVGSWCAEGLVRSGVVDITIVDHDTICATNINRQVQAMAGNIGEPKVGALAKRLAAISPWAKISALQTVFDEDSCDSFKLGQYDYVVDAIDSVGSKVLLIERCVTLGVPVYSSMGAAGKSDPSLIRTGLLRETTVCPLARMVRRNLRRAKIDADIPCVYSTERSTSPRRGETYDPASHDSGGAPGEETPQPGRGDTLINGSLVHITAVFGFMLAGLVINDISRRAAEGGV